MIEEIWKDIPGYDGYQASNFGNIKVFVKGKERILKSNLQSKGYRMVSVRPKANLVHRLVAFSFIPNPENKRYINHIDGNKQNNMVSNLEWCTNSENMKHAYMMGLINSSESGNGRGKDKCKRKSGSGRKIGSGRKSNMNNVDVLDIRSSKLKAPELAKIYNVSRPHICNIISGKRLQKVV